MSSKYFIEDTELKRVAFDDGEWVDIKAEFTQADQDYLLQQMAEAHAVGKDAKVSIKLGRLPMLERGVMAWSFAEGGKAVPINRETLSRLKGAYREKVLETINNANEQAGEYVRKNS